VKLKPGADSQDLLNLVASHARVNRFEIMEPSVEEIFIDAVGDVNA
jgi:ABC-2 type transport system ATP-binding protein